MCHHKTNKMIDLSHTHLWSACDGDRGSQVGGQMDSLEVCIRSDGTADVLVGDQCGCVGWLVINVDVFVGW